VRPVTGPSRRQSRLSVQPLSQVPELKPTVSAWLLSEWPTWYGEGAPGDLVGDVEAFARSPSSLPVGFVVFMNEEPVGFGTLKQESIPSHTHLSPWAATGFVLPHHRGQGVGAFLLQALVANARAMGFRHVYSGTSTAVSLLQRAGWEEVEQVVHAGRPLTIFRSGIRS
jgi:GNAT superfamily N-acetyltransferase